MKANLRRKVVVSIGTAVMTACCLTSTTYAWFAKNAEAWTDPVDFKLHIEEGLQISVDGENYYDSINRGLLTQAIAVYRYNKMNPDAQKTIAELTKAEVESYSQTEIAAVSPDDEMNFYGYDTCDHTIAADCSIMDYDGGNKTYDTKSYIKDGYYQPHNLTEEGRYKGYISFTLYFRAIASSSDGKDKYKLVFANEALSSNSLGTSYIRANMSTVKLANALTTPTQAYTSGMEIEINPANAMRIAVTREDNETLIYEPNQGIGSYALGNIPDGALDDSVKDLYDPALSPMVTYFDNTHNWGKLSYPDYDEKYINTIKDFEGLESLGTFTRDEHGNYNDVSVTFNIWLDGYDADYLEGVDTSSISFFLNFTKTEEA